jgi:hypothetical protein
MKRAGSALTNNGTKKAPQSSVLPETAGAARRFVFQKNISIYFFFSFLFYFIIVDSKRCILPISLKLCTGTKNYITWQVPIFI